ncbi:hypothetical protein H4219_003818 [Mycoemilia scoparia]|uniref:Glutathione S-transferase n=1 Tax=Mycoemilia scoparia TaxID=417184 RepID=A0A9W7ZU03_9FUNG|nr:hypothetical protein H4219_003818 [Mycoemilia scoparia]
MSSSTSYELIYFNVIGLGETSRIILTYGDADWKETNPEWPAFKPNTPFGRLPVLIERKEGHEDLVISESEVIERYLSRKFGLLSSDPEVAVKQEQIRAQYSDARTLWIETEFTKHENLRPRFDEEVALLVSKHEEILEKNGNNGHYFGNELTYPDIAAYVILNGFKEYGYDSEITEEKAPRLNKLLKVVGEQVKAIKAKRQ